MGGAKDGDFDDLVSTTPGKWGTLASSATRVPRSCFIAACLAYRTDRHSPEQLSTLHGHGRKGARWLFRPLLLTAVE